jgi:putative membrane protein
MLDLTLAIFHHLLVFCLFGILFVEFWVVRDGMTRQWVDRMVSIDLWYGILAVLILLVGFSRAIFAAKGWYYYEHNAFFWLKILVFVAIALLSVSPTRAFFRWRRVDAMPQGNAISAVRRFIWAQLILFPLLPVFAAIMARGYGEAFRLSN